MKANQKFRDSDAAVSPVIAVILMVAITVVLSATVYVWVSGFGGKSQQPAQAVTLISDQPIRNGFTNFTVTAANPTLYYRDLQFTLDGESLAITGTCAATPGDNVTLCRGTTPLTGESLVKAGDRVNIEAATGQTLRIIDLESNSILFTAIVG